ncbi:hypothetical protein JIN84_06420 [Luteolibacter yonseiensis]|uniref:Uncharacterized protein n=1 Tax=Luteolibacter yonseiensis TaxID=1144680 RepID=A0A934R4X0_9BACT|nr:hypothetical protein [Luteolibacter yonseiensis]MBK1815239.1 hypothetical protein [Luteolibacter yonseiensis]
MYLLPSEILLSLYLLIPVAIVAFHWRNAVGWVWSSVACAALSWLFSNTAMFLYPPDNGLANFVTFVMGWFWMLPPLWLLLSVDSIIQRIWMRSSRLPLRRHLGGVVFRHVSIISLVIMSWGMLGWMSRDRAVVEAGRELSERGYQIVGPEEAVFSKGRWIVRYPESDFGEICLTRNGRMAWIGGPG